MAGDLFPLQARVPCGRGIVKSAPTGQFLGTGTKPFTTNVNEISPERRSGYSWFNDSPRSALQLYERWKKRIRSRTVHENAETLNPLSILRDLCVRSIPQNCQNDRTNKMKTQRRRVRKGPQRRKVPLP